MMPQNKQRCISFCSVFISFFLFSLFIINNNNIIIISYSGGQLDGPVAFLGACLCIILYYIHLLFYVFLGNKDACLLRKLLLLVVIRRSAWVGFLSLVCLLVRSITQKRMIPKHSKLVLGMTLGYPTSDMVLG